VALQQQAPALDGDGGRGTLNVQPMPGVRERSHFSADYLLLASRKLEQKKYVYKKSLKTTVAKHFYETRFFTVRAENGFEEGTYDS
jgi:hypothetical protein